MPFEEKEFAGLRAQMAIYGHSHEDLAKLLDKNPQYVGRRLRGQIEWSISDIRSICNIYKKSFEELFN